MHRFASIALLVISFGFGDDELRDLSSYDVIGPFDIFYGASNHKEVVRVTGQVREFLWDHWRQHKRGTVSAKYRFVDAAARLDYFVEPDSNGRWVIVEYELTIYPKAARFACGEFERVEPDRLHLPLVKIPESEARQPEQYLLHPVCSNENGRLW
jgi:hypothetical protein